MRIISFAWTTNALLSGRKSVTRRTWKDCRIQPGELVQAYDKSPRFRGHPVAIIRVLSVSRERLDCIDNTDEKLEGHLWGDAKGYIKAFLDSYPGMKASDNVWRIEFEVVSKFH